MNPPSGVAEQQKAAVWRLIDEGFNENDPGVCDDLCHPHFVTTASIVAVPIGPEGMRRHIENARGGISEFSLDVVGLVGDGAGHVAVTWITRGKADGYFGGGTGDGDTSGWLIGFFELRDGLISRFDASWEPLRLLVQTGAIGDHPTHERTAAHVLDIPDISALRTEQHPGPVGRDAAVVHRPPSSHDPGEITELAARLLAESLGGDPAPPTAAGLLSSEAWLSFADHGLARGPAGLAERRASMGQVLSDVTVAVERSIVEEGGFALRCRLRARHTGDYLGLPGTGRAIDVHVSVAARMERGKVVEWIEVLDLLGLLRQVGGLSTRFLACYPDQ